MSEDAARMLSNNGRHSVASIEDTIHERMALYDRLPRELRDVMKEQSFNYSPVSMRDWAEQRGVDWVAAYMRDFDRQHWRDFFQQAVGAPYPDAD